MPDDAPEAVRSGACLREARERVGWSLPEMAAGLHISLSHLEALEDGRISLLPGGAYAVGYVRSYASALGLDAEEMVRRFKAEAAKVSRKTELSFPVPMPERSMPAGAVMLVGLVLCIGAYAGWYRLSGDGRLPAETVSSIPERLAPLAQQALPPPAVIVMAKPVEPAPVPAPMVVAADPAPAVQPISPSSAAAALVHEPSGNPVSPVDRSRMVLRANADAWVQVKDRSGTLLLNRILKAGETWPVPRQDLVMTTGNAGGTEVLVDGVAIPPLGGIGAVRRDIALDPVALGNAKASVPAAAAQQAAAPPVAAMRGHQ